MSDPSPPWPGSEEDRVIDAMCANGDSPHWGECRAVVLRLVGLHAHGLSPQDREDICQRVMIKVHLFLAGFQRRAKLRTWLNVLAVREVITYLRSQYPPGTETTSLDARQARDDSAPREPAAPLDVERYVERRDFLYRVIEAINRYIVTRNDPERARSIINQWLQDMRDAEIAAQLGLAPHIIANVKYQLQRYLEPMSVEWRTDHFAPARHQSPSSATEHVSNAPDAPERDNGGVS